MFYVIVKNGSTVVGKDVYFGDDAKNRELVALKRVANPELSFTETDDVTFAAVKI